MNTTTCRWGILGTGHIAHKNWQSIHDAGNATLVAVASRAVQRSATFIAECISGVPMPQVPEALGSYEALIARDDIDALYIPLPTLVRKEWVIKAAKAGKHVLVEKPLGASAEDVKEMIAACDASGVQFMDGVMFMHGSRLKRLREVLDDKRSVGEIRRITSQFTFNGGEEFMRGNIRTNGSLEPLGCLGDLGWYCVRFSLWALGYQMPSEVRARVHTEFRHDATAPAVPTELSGELLFADGVSASFHCSFVSLNSQWAVVSGTHGFLRVPDFVLPFSGAQTTFSVTQSALIVDRCQFDMHERRQDESLPEPSSNAPGSQESNMFRTFSNLVLSGRRDPHWPEIALKTQQVVDACMKSARQDGASVLLG